MQFNPITSITQVYQSIPGKTAFNKTTFLGQKALQTTPFVAMGYYLRGHAATISCYLKGRVSSGMVINCLDALPVLAERLSNPQLIKMLLSFGIGLEVHRGLKAATMCKNASSPAGRFAFFCTTYAAAYYATSYFRSLYKEPDNTEVQQPTVYSAVVDLALKCIALPIQLKYRPFETIAGLSAGAFFAKNNYSEYIKTLKKDRNEVVQKFLEDLSNQLNDFSTSPLNETKMMSKIWNEWNSVVLSVASSAQAFNSSVYLGKELISSLGMIFANLRI